MEITTASHDIASGEKAKARDIIAAIRTLQAVEQEHRPATDRERQTLARFGGFGAVALSLFPDPVTGRYKDAGWQTLGEELRVPAQPAEYDSAKRTTFTAFYTSPTVISAMHEALARLGVPPTRRSWSRAAAQAISWRHAEAGQRFIGVELDSISGRIARVLHPAADIRIENFRDTRLPPLDAVIGNVPFADLKLDFHGRKLPFTIFLSPRASTPSNPAAYWPLSPAISPSTSRTPPSASISPARPISWARSACRPTPSNAKARRS